MTSLASQVTRGSVWMLLFKLADRLLAVVGIAFLARLLVPADFGLVAMGTSLVAAVELLNNFGFDIALLRDRDFTRERFDSAWTLNALLGLACAGLLLLFTVPAVLFYGEPRLEWLVPVLAIGTAVGGFENIGTVVFRRDLDFRREFYFLTGKRIASFAVTLALAFLWRSYWALAVGTVLSRVAGVAISYRMHPYRPRWSLAEAPALVNFSRWLLFTNFIGFFQSRMPDFLIGRAFGAYTVGVYSTAADIARMPSTELGAPINRAAYPGYARDAGDPAAVAALYLRVAASIWTLALPASVGLWFVAQPFVRAFLGPGWLDAVPVVQVLAFAGLCNLVTSNQYYVYMALARGRIATWLGIVQLAVSLACALAWLPDHGDVGVAYGVLAGAALDLPLSFVAFRRVTGIAWRALLLSLWRPTLACAAMLVVLATLFPGDAITVSDEAGAIRVLAVATLSGAAAYGGALLLAWTLAGRPAGPEAQALSLLKERLASLRG